jgi:zinc transport system substrate-binding protein
MRPIAAAFVGLFAIALSVPAVAAPRVVATFKPVHGIVAAIMDGVATPALLIDTPVSPHAYALTPSKRRLLENADIVIGIGPQMEGGIWEALQSLPGRHVALIDFVRGELIGTDPHLWLDTAIVADLGDVLARILGDADPDNAPRYLANAGRLRATLTGLEAALAAGLPRADARLAVSYHAGFSFFARQWRLGYSFVVVEPDMAPAAGAVARLRDAAARGEIACLMTEPQFRPDLLAALAADFGLPVVEADPVGANLSAGPGFYPALIEQVAAAFAQCFALRR